MKKFNKNQIQIYLKKHSENFREYFFNYNKNKIDNKCK